MNPITPVLQQDYLLSQLIKKIKSNYVDIDINISMIQDEVYKLNIIISKTLKRKILPCEYDLVISISNKWDSILSYYNTGTGNLKIPFDKGQNFCSRRQGDKTKRYLCKVIKTGAMKKTITVINERIVKHFPTGKYINRRKKLLVHDENGIASEGDMVVISSCRPISKMKHHRLIKRIY